MCLEHHLRASAKTIICIFIDTGANDSTKHNCDKTFIIKNTYWQTHPKILKEKI